MGEFFYFETTTLLITRFLIYISTKFGFENDRKIFLPSFVVPKLTFSREVLARFHFSGFIRTSSKISSAAF